MTQSAGAEPAALSKTARSTAPAGADAASRGHRIAEYLSLAFLLGALAVGLYARFIHLGERQLAQDEFFFVRSIRSILEHGVPTLHGGGYYLRGLLPQYATAATVALLGDHGLSYRLPSALFGLGAVAASYYYARLHLPRALALAVPALLLVSSWEVEFARFARMYAAFQFTTVLLLITVTRTLRGWKKGRLWLPLAVLASLLSHQLALLFLPTLALPPLVAWWREGRVRLRDWLMYLAGSAAIVALGLAFFLVPFRNLGVANALPAGLPPAPSGGVLRLPDIGAAEYLLPLAGLIAVGAGARLAVRVRRGENVAPEALAWAAFAGALLGQLLVWGVLLAGLVLRFGDPRRRSRGTHLVAAASVLLVLAWSTQVLLTGLGPADMVRRLAGWPDWIGPVFRPWRNEMPLLGLLLLGATALSLALHARDSIRELLAAPAVFVAAMIAALGLLESTYVSTRYLFFAYPATLVVLASAAWRIAGRFSLPAATALVVIPLFLLSEDFKPSHLAHVGSPEASFRIGAFERQAQTWYVRHDFLGVASYLNQDVREERGRGGAPEPVVVLPPSAVREYLRRPSILYIPRDNPEFRAQSRDMGTRDVWMGQALASTPSELREYVGASSRFVLVSPAGTAVPPELVSLWDADSVHVTDLYTSRDGRLEVRRLVRIEEPNGSGPARGPGTTRAPDATRQEPGPAFERPPSAAPALTSLHSESK